jgi:hypothetical protein
MLRGRTAKVEMDAAIRRMQRRRAAFAMSFAACLEAAMAEGQDNGTGYERVAAAIERATTEARKKLAGDSDWAEAKDFAAIRRGETTRWGAPSLETSEWQTDWRGRFVVYGVVEILQRSGSRDDHTDLPRRGYAWHEAVAHLLGRVELADEYCAKVRGDW